MCEEIEKMKKAERIKIAQRIISSEKFTYDEIAYFTNLTLEKIKTLTNNEKGAVALSISAQLLFLCKKITARPRKNPAVGVKLSYATN